MWKSTAKTILFALGMSTLGTGCDVQDLIDFLNSIQPPPPPVEDCESELDQCLASGIDSDVCFFDYEICVNGEPPPPPVTDCEEQLDQCLNGGSTAGGSNSDAAMPYPGDDDCWFQYEQCIDDEPPPPPPPVDDCERELEICLDDAAATGQNPDDCFVAFDECIGIEPPPVDICEQQLEDCLNGGTWTEPSDPNVDPTVPYPGEDYCWVQYDDCIGIEPPPPPPVSFCDEQLEQCLNGGTWTEPDPNGDAAMPPLPPEDDCWFQYEQCIDEEPPPPPIDPCEEVLDQCLEQFIGADGALLPGHEVCFEQHEQCYGEPVPMPEPGDGTNQP